MALPTAMDALHLVDIHDLGPEGFEAVQADLDELSEDLLHVPARVDGDELARRLRRAVPASQPRLEEALPQRRPHHQPALGAPVVVEGIVRPGWSGVPYLSRAEINPEAD